MKKKLTLSIDAKLLEVAKNEGVNLSATLEEALGKKFGYEKHESWEVAD